MERYDFILPIGGACSASQTVREAKLQRLSFPFDWIYYSEMPEGAQDLALRVDAICSGFRDWLNVGDLEIRPSPAWHDKDFYHNRRTCATFNHDFAKGQSLQETFPAVRKKYDRRIERLYRCLLTSRRILLVRVDPPPGVPIDDQDLLKARKRLSEKFPKACFDVVHFAYEAGRPFDDRLEVAVDCGFTRIQFDYRDYSPGKPDYEVDLQKTGALLKERFSVRDYRTIGERLARKLPRLENDLLLKFHPKILAARLHRRKFAHILPLGVNCEVAFRFYSKWRFFDSSLFAWAQSFNLATVTRALENLPALLAGEVTLHEPSGMWKCENLGILFHGQLKWGKGQRYDAQTLQDDLNSLKGRIAHLRMKFLACLRDEKPTLLIHRLAESDETSPELDARLRRLESVLRSLGARNITLLVLSRERSKDNMPAAPRRLFRFVREFNPCDKVTQADVGDPVGWTAIYTEFAPKTILPKRHAFKFE